MLCIIKLSFIWSRAFEYSITSIFDDTCLILYRTSPFGNTRMYKLGWMILWNCPFFSFRKKVSGIQTFFESVMVRYFILPWRSLKAKRLSFHCWRKVIWTLYSCWNKKMLIVDDHNSIWFSLQRILKWFRFP